MSSYSELLQAFNDRLSSALRVSMPCIVESYNFAKQEADVRPVLKRVYTDGRTEEMPIIPNVPVIFPRSGGASFTMPVKPGDGVLVVFADRSIEEWVARGGITEPTDPRKHDLSDAIAIVGCISPAVPAQAENNDDVLLTYAGSKVRLKPAAKIEIECANMDVLALNEIDIQATTINVLAVDIGVTATNITVNAPSINVNSVNIDIDTVFLDVLAVTINATAVATNLLSATTTVTGIVNIIGATTVTGLTQITGALNVTGTITSQVDVLAGPELISLVNHTHAGDGLPPS